MEKKEIFLYTDETEIDSETLKALADDGYIPVKVKSLDSVKIMAPAMSAARLDSISAAALKCVKTSDAVSRMFGKSVVDALLTEMKP